MANSAKVPDQVAGRARRAVLPARPIGWWSLALTVVAVASWFVLPLITRTFREAYPITDTWIMPAIGTVLLDAAAVLSVLCVWRWRERSLLNVVALVVIVPLALLFTLASIVGAVAGE